MVATVDPHFLAAIRGPDVRRLRAQDLSNQRNILGLQQDQAAIEQAADASRQMQNFLGEANQGESFDFDGLTRNLASAGMMDQALKVAEVRKAVQQDDGVGVWNQTIEFLNSGGAKAMQTVPAIKEQVNKGLVAAGGAPLSDEQIAVFASEDRDIQKVEQSDGTIDLVDMSTGETFKEAVGGKRPTGPLVQNVMGANGRTQLLTPEELRAEGFAEGSVVQVDDKGKRQVLRSPSTKTAAERKDSAQREIALDNLSALKTLVTDNPELPIGPVAGRALRLRAATGAGEELTEIEAEMLSLEENLSNQLLAAVRGAQVGPAEQKRFERQLPRIEHQRALFMKNLNLTTKNLEKLNNKISKAQGEPVESGLKVGESKKFGEVTIKRKD